MILEGGQGTNQIQKQFDAVHLQWHIITNDEWLARLKSNPQPPTILSSVPPCAFCARERLTSQAAQQDVRLEWL